MVRQSVRLALLVGTVAAWASASPARASDHHGSSGCCAPSTKTICVTECVPETYTAKRTVYRQEQRVEKYTAYKCETVQEQRERTVTCYKTVTEWVDQVRKVSVQVPVCEERTVMKPHYTYVNETKYITKCVDRGHYECREVYSHWKALSNSLHGLCASHDPCNPCCTPCPPSNCVTRKVWVPCMVQEQCPVTCCRKVCEMRAEVVKVNTCRTECRDVVTKVCVTKCIPETRVEKYTVCKTISVPYEATRTVCVCVPCEETYTATRYVSRQVMREVPCQPACSTSCCGSGHSLFSGCGLFRSHGCNSGCNTGCGGHSWFRGCSLFGNHGGCGTGCNTGCGGCN